MYNETVQDHYRQPRNLGRLPNADGIGEVTLQEAGVDWLQVSLRREGERIVEARFRAIGCAATVAAGSAMTVWLVGRRLNEAGHVTAGIVLEILGGLPDDKLYSADLAATAVRKAAEAAQRSRIDSESRPALD